ncbi:MAG: anti-sigma factor [Planctomycetota bacterium]
MKCKKIQKYIELYLDGELDTKEKTLFMEHISTCPDCAKLLKAAEKEITLYKKALSPFRMAESLKNTVVSRIRLLGIPRKDFVFAAEAKKWILFSLPAVAAAVLVIAIGISGLTLSPPVEEAVQGKWSAIQPAAIYDPPMAKVYW